MASAATRNVLATIAVTESVAHLIERIYRDRPRNKTVLDLCKKAKDATQKAFTAWPDQLNEKEVNRIYAALQRFETKVFAGDADTVFLTSTALAIVGTIEPVLSDQKRDAIVSAGKKMFALHRYFDRRFDKPETYDRANDAARFWEVEAQI